VVRRRNNTLPRARARDFRATEQNTRAVNPGLTFMRFCGIDTKRSVVAFRCAFLFWFN
jgi:hypothetical protein